MEAKLISDFTTLPEFADTDVLLIEKGGTFYKVTVAAFVAHVKSKRKFLVIKLTQEGTAGPLAIVEDNTTGTAVTIEGVRTGEGEYMLTLSAAVLGAKNLVSHNEPINSQVYFEITSPTTINVKTLSGGVPVLQDDVLLDYAVTIEVL